MKCSRKAGEPRSGLVGDRNAACTTARAGGREAWVLFLCDCLLLEEEEAAARGGRTAAFKKASTSDPEKEHHSLSMSASLSAFLSWSSRGVLGRVLVQENTSVRASRAYFTTGDRPADEGEEEVLRSAEANCVGKEVTMVALPVEEEEEARAPVLRA
jgi:hypothetical protein